MIFVRRFALALLVGFLTASFSGAMGFIVPEPCAVTEASPVPDGLCAPTCATCGCCHQPMVMSPTVTVALHVELVREPRAASSNPVSPEPAEIFHVPRLA